MSYSYKKKRFPSSEEEIDYLRKKIEEKVSVREIHEHYPSHFPSRSYKSLARRCRKIREERKFSGFQKFNGFREIDREEIQV